MVILLPLLQDRFLLGGERGFHGGFRGHRSSSPAIMLTEPKVGTMSAIMEPLSSFRQGRHDVQARRPAAHAVGAVAAVRDDVEAEFAVAALDGGVGSRPPGS